VLFMKPPSCWCRRARPWRCRRPRRRAITSRTGGGAHGGGGRHPRGRGAQPHQPLSPGLDLTLRDLQSELKKKSWPWELAKAFDQAAPLGETGHPIATGSAGAEIHLHVNAPCASTPRPATMLFSVARRSTSCRAPGTAGPATSSTPAHPRVGPLVAGDRLLLESAGIGRFEGTALEIAGDLWKHRRGTRRFRRKRH